MLHIEGLSFDGDSMLMLILVCSFGHCVELGWIADVSEEHAAFIFRVKVCRIRMMCHI